MKIQPHNPKMSYMEQIRKYYAAFYKRNIPVDFVQDTADFSRYKLLVAPLQYLMDPELEQRYRDYVRGGGHLVLTMRTGVKDVYNRCMCQAPLPGGLSDVRGYLREHLHRFGGVKTSAAWLIDHAGFHKGFKTAEDAKAGLSTMHTLALTNRGGAQASDVADLARAVQDGVEAAFGVRLVPEPVVVGMDLR